MKLIDAECMRRINLSTEQYKVIEARLASGDVKDEFGAVLLLEEITNADGDLIIESANDYDDIKLLLAQEGLYVD